MNEEDKLVFGYPFLDAHVSTQTQSHIFFCDQKHRKWRISAEFVPPKSEIKFKSLALISSFKLLCLNVYFGPQAQQERSEAFVQLVEEKKPDVICLQEVTLDFLKVVASSPYIQQNYWISHDAGQKILYEWDGYGVCMLGSFKTMPLPCENKVSTWSFPTTMSREFLVADFPSDDNSTTKFSIGTTHLESLHHPSTRAKQLNICCRTPQLNEIPHRIICGDFNFDSSRNYHENPFEKVILENDQLKKYKDFVDVWPLLRPEEKGYTFDTEKNTMKGDEFEQFRFDRILFKSSPPAPAASVSTTSTDAATSDVQENEWKAKHIEMVGTEKLFTLELRTHDQDIFLSDHFGLLAEFGK